MERLREWLLPTVPRHPILLLCACICVVVDSCNVVFTQSFVSLIVAQFLVYVLLCLAIPIHPRTCAVSVIVVFLVGVYMPGLRAESMLLGLAFAWGTAFRFLPVTVGLSLALVSLPALFLGADSDTAAASLILQLCACVAGYTCKQFDRSLQARERHVIEVKTSRELQQDMLFASRLHDRVTNDLSFITTTAITRLPRSGSDERQMLEAIIERARHAYDQTHEIIDMLNAPRHGSEKGHGCTVFRLQNDLELILADQDEYLQQLGFHGTYDVRSSYINGDVNPQAYLECTSVVREMCNNIRRHCPTGKDYTIRLTFSRNAVNIVEMNTGRMSTKPRRHPSKGLRMHRTIIESLGGSIHAAADGNTWIVRASIPLAVPAAT